MYVSICIYDLLPIYILSLYVLFSELPMSNSVRDDIMAVMSPLDLHPYSVYNTHILIGFPKFSKLL